MKSISNLPIPGYKLHSRIWTVVFCGVTALALSAPAMAKDRGLLWNPGGPVDFTTTVDAVREVPAGDPMPGLHLDVKVDGHDLDVYLAPMDFCHKFDVDVMKGDSVQIIGAQLAGKPGEVDVVLAHELSVGERGSKSATFHPTLTVYLRNDDGPFWVEAKPVQSKSASSAPAGR